MKKELERILEEAKKVLALTEEKLDESRLQLHNMEREDSYFEICNLMNRYASYHY